MTTPFKALRPRTAESRALAGLSARIDARVFDAFDVRGLAHKMVAALADRRALPLKEVFESFEFFERTRRRLRAPQMADLCCGHGLTGLVFAAFEREVEEVVLLDIVEPESHAVVLEAVASVAPWVADKVRFERARVRDATDFLGHGASIVAIHACGVRTDRSIDAALALGGAVGLMPCCYSHKWNQAPQALQDALGVEVSTDVARTYRLEGAGYNVAWRAVPAEITPMHRVLIAHPTPV